MGGVLPCFIVFLFRNTIFICVPLKSFVIFFASFPLYVKIAHFVLFSYGIIKSKQLLGLCCSLSIAKFILVLRLLNSDKVLSTSIFF
jgi:hypothetical protein